MRLVVATVASAFLFHGVLRQEKKIAFSRVLKGGSGGAAAMGAMASEGAG